MINRITAPWPAVRRYTREYEAGNGEPEVGMTNRQEWEKTASRHTRCGAGLL
jgi:hypothetical protein